MRAAPPRTHPFRTIALILTPEPSVLVRKAQCYGADILESPAATRTGPGSADTLDPLRITFVDQPLDLMAREAVGLVLGRCCGFRRRRCPTVDRSPDVVHHPFVNCGGPTPAHLTEPQDMSGRSRS